jgi:hypothetical protein
MEPEAGAGPAGGEARPVALPTGWPGNNRRRAEAHPAAGQSPQPTGP